MKKVVTIGGGTGSFMLLSGLKHYPIELSAIVSMADDGGSTGILRDELGVLPPGDVRQCLAALSDSSEMLRKLMNYRFEEGGLGYGEAKKMLLKKILEYFGPMKKIYDKYQASPKKVYNILSRGERRVRKISEKKMETVRKLSGLKG